MLVAFSQQPLTVFRHSHPKLFPALVIALLTGFFGMVPIRAELTEQQKKALFRKNHPGAYPPAKAPSGPKKKASSSGSKKKSSAGSGKKKSSGSSKSAGQKKIPAESKEPRRTDMVSTASNSATAPHPAPMHSQVTPHEPLPVQSGTDLPLPHGAIPSAPITIEKSGIEAEQGLEPAPASSKPTEGFWSRLFGSHRNYNYLSPSVRAAIDRAHVKRGRWKYIVIHNSGTREGNARVFDIYHSRVRHMQNGLAYHFVIGDGHGSGDGQIEIGNRWKRQINGGHVASDYLNDIALGICLVGDFNRDVPTKAQVGAVEELVFYLRNRVGKSQGRQAIVHAHKEINPRPTDCPGDHFPYGWLHAKFGNAR